MKCSLSAVDGLIVQKFELWATNKIAYYVNNNSTSNVILRHVNVQYSTDYAKHVATSTL